MFNFAIERDIVTANPCAQIKAPAKENRRDRCLSQDEIKTFWNGLQNASMSEATRLSLKFQLVTAQRKGEVIAAESAEIDFIEKIWTIPAERAKNGNAHRVPLSELAFELLEEIKILGNASRWLFPSTLKNSPMGSQSIDHAVRRSKHAFPGMEDFCPHDLRRTAATHMASMKITSEVLSRILNHSKRGVTEQHYIRHGYDDEKRYALDAWSQRLKELDQRDSSRK